MTVRAVLSPLRPTGSLVAQLNTIASSGNYDVAILDKLLQRASRRQWRDKAAKYYLASLYLHLEQPLVADEILKGCGRPGGEMKKYFAVLDYCRQQGLPLPELNARETRCIEYLSGALSMHDNALARYVESFGAFTVGGNSPLDNDIVAAAGDCLILFNHYAKNQRIQGKASVHVVTPSWQFEEADDISHLVITGNSIFHRRSNVWRRFMQCDTYQSVFTMPQSLWRELYARLEAPASAGLLMLAYLAEYATLSAVSGTVVGFSAGQPTQNHSYDNVPASTRHNWAEESLLRDKYLRVLRGQCQQFAGPAVRR